MQPKLISLGLDTSTSHCGISIVSGADTLIEINENIGKKHAETLMVLTQRALDTAQLDWTDLNVIGVGVGPGNFTGSYLKGHDRNSTPYKDPYKGLLDSWLGGMGSRALGN